MYTAQQIDAVINYNASADIFYITENKRVIWDMRNGDVEKLKQAGVAINYAEEFAKLKKQVRKKLVADKVL